MWAAIKISAFRLEGATRPERRVEWSSRWESPPTSVDASSNKAMYPCCEYFESTFRSALSPGIVNRSSFPSSSGYQICKVFVAFISRSTRTASLSTAFVGGSPDAVTASDCCTIAISPHLSGLSGEA